MKLSLFIQKLQVLEQDADIQAIWVTKDNDILIRMVDPTKPFYSFTDGYFNAQQESPSIDALEKKKLQIEVGKSYRTRSGSVISISYALENNTDYYVNGYRFSGDPCGQCYTDEGLTYTDSTENPGDLIEEVI